MSLPVLGSGETTGTFYYDYPDYRVDRVNGKWDRYCGTVYKFRNTPCSHIVKDNLRYLYFPEKNDCCFCCDAEHGCGALKPDWIIDAEYVKESTESGETFDVFNKKGLQDNFYW